MDSKRISFNKPYLSGKELYNISLAIHNGQTAGNKMFTKKCHTFFENTFSFKKCLLTTSCTDALEMAALLLNIEPGDEVIVPSFTFVSTANAFVLRGAKIVFADSREDQPNIDSNKLEALITPKTKAIVVVHYAGVACDMNPILKIAKKHELFVVEDAAQAIDSYYNGRALGSIGDFGTFSFHETKNIISGEGGMLSINNEKYTNRSEILWEKGTNRSAFFRGEVDKYNWVDVGSSFLPSEMISAFLYAQLENIDSIQAKRKAIWNNYYTGFSELKHSGKVKLPMIPEYATNNAHMFYLICSDFKERSSLIKYLKGNSIQAVFHYLSLHKSPYFMDKHDGRELVNSDKYTNSLVRLPLYFELDVDLQNRVIDSVLNFYKSI